MYNLIHTEANTNRKRKTNLKGDSNWDDLTKEDTHALYSLARAAVTFWLNHYLPDFFCFDIFIVIEDKIGTSLRYNPGHGDDPIDCLFWADI